MKEILAAYERLLLFRLQAEPPVDEEELRGLLADWYQLKMLSDWSRLKRAREEQERRDPPPAGREDGADAGTAEEQQPPESKAANGLFGPKAVFKRGVLDRLAEARSSGYSLSAIEKAGAGAFTIEQLTRMANREKVPFELWEALDRTLNGLADRVLSP